MTLTPSTLIDPATGLPLDDFSGIIQQIPLGSQVFPFEDLNADGRMTRQPIYGDDILPTSALIVGQDTKGQARAGTMDSARRLWTREAVFQNNGAAIPDGTTAPIDVNVVGGGGGGGLAPAGMACLSFYGQAKAAGGSGSIQGIAYNTLTTIYGYTFSFFATSAVTGTTHYITLSIVSPIGGEFLLAALPLSAAVLTGSMTVMYPIPLLITQTLDYHSMTLNVGNPGADVVVTGALFTNVL